jgi:molybdopterin synthase catalytic subunit
MDVVRLAEIRDTELTVDEVHAAVLHPEAGGVAVFTGVVRDHDQGRDVVGLSYSAHPTAGAELRRVAGRVASEHSALAVAAVHRVGDLDVGDLAVIVAVSCQHRAEAFAACRQLIDDVKSSVPIWKHQRFAGGASEWVGSA